jgi:glycerol-3-phosphate dehydrogenase
MVPTPLDGLDAVLNRCRPAADGDIVVPHRGEAVLGTTSEAVDDPDDYPTDEAAVERVRRECARMLAADAADLPARRPYWGVRPLYDPNQAGEERAISRGFALLDHRDRDDLAGLTTLVGGKLTTHRLMGEAAADLVCERLGVAGTCRTDERSLPAEDPAALDELVREFGGPAPADAGPLDGAVEP